MSSAQPRPRAASLSQFIRMHPAASLSAASFGALAASAIVNWQLARKAERDNPPTGSFLDVDGVRLHYVERGAGPILVLLHGNGSMIQDFESSGLIDRAAAHHRVVVFDRPGFGHSDRPRNVIWTPQAQARLIARALAQLDVSRAILLGHSWGASVAVAMGLAYPELVRGLVLASGYYYSSLRIQAPALSTPPLPAVGDVFAYTVSPLVSRLIWPLLMRKIFGPAAVPAKFSGFPKAMAVRPSQIRAAAEEASLMLPDATQLENRYTELKMPVSIVVGADDRLIDADDQSGRLHGDLTGSRFHSVAGAGHMVHQSAIAAVMSVITEIALAADSRDNPALRTAASG